MFRVLPASMPRCNWLFDLKTGGNNDVTFYTYSLFQNNDSANRQFFSVSCRHFHCGCIVRVIYFPRSLNLNLTAAIHLKGACGVTGITGVHVTVTLTMFRSKSVVQEFVRCLSMKGQAIYACELLFKCDSTAGIHALLLIDFFNALLIRISFIVRGKKLLLKWHDINDGSFTLTTIRMPYVW